MGVSSRTAAAVHALTFLAHRHDEGLQSSATIAESLESNPVVVRRVLGLLREAGIVTATEGAGGGWRLARPADSITLLDVFTSVEDDTPVLPTHAHPPSRSCVIGRHMESYLAEEFAAAQRALADRLATRTIADTLREVRRREAAS